LFKAGQPKQKANAAYFTEVGTGFRGSLEDGDDKLPMGIDFQVSSRLLMEPGGERIEQMDQHGIGMQILSYSNPTQDTPADQVIELTQKANDIKLAAKIQAAPSRLGGFAALPWQHPEAAADKLERAVKQLGLVGTLLMGRPGDVFLDDSRFEPTLAKLDELGCRSICIPDILYRRYSNLTTRAWARRCLRGSHCLAGLAQRSWCLSAAGFACEGIRPVSNLRVISGQWGEMVPF
jgi:predicted TIM-barrel fold metal-dependent hydrolase